MIGLEKAHHTIKLTKPVAECVCVCVHACACARVCAFECMHMCHENSLICSTASRLEDSLGEDSDDVTFSQLIVQTA